MKKIIISTLAVMLTVPAFATGISPNDTGDNMCIYNVLNTYTGPANLQAGWQANTIELKWYNGDQQLNVQSAANNCTYDSGLTIPSTAPTKTGYTFAGWRVKTAAASNSPVCGLTSALVATDGTAYGYRNDSTGEYGPDSSNDTTYGLTSDQTWAVEFSHGIVRGTASCNSTTGSNFGEDTSPSGTMSSSDTGQYCWCHAESYTPTGSSSCNVSSLAWVFDVDFESAGDCAYNCAFDCASSVLANSPFRAAVFGVAAN